MNKAYLAKDLKLGVAIHRIVEGPVDSNTKKDEKYKVAIPAKLFTVETVVINQLKGQASPGGMDVVVINGGKSTPNGKEGELIFNPNKELEHDINSLIDRGVKKDTWFANYDTVSGLCNTINQIEIERLDAIVNDLLMQIDTLGKVKNANEVRCAELKTLNAE